MKQIAVLGSDGQLGKTLKSLAESQTDQYMFYSKQDIDITNKKSIEDAFTNHSFEFCVNCAAYTNVEAAEENSKDAFLINAEGVKNIAEVCQSKNIKLIHISTDYVFDGQKTTPYKINDKTNPINEYGKSKLKGELYIKETLKSHYILRASWLYSVYGKNFVKTIIKHLGEKNSLKITTKEKGTPTSCIDLSGFIFYIINKGNIPYGIYNFSARGSTTWYGFACKISEFLTLGVYSNILPTKSYKTLAKRPTYSVLDISHTEKVYKGLHQWEESLEIIIDKIINTEK